MTRYWVLGFIIAVVVAAYHEPVGPSTAAGVGCRPHFDLHPSFFTTHPSTKTWSNWPKRLKAKKSCFDYVSTGLTLRRHPMTLLRDLLAERTLITAEQLNSVPNGRVVHYCGIVTLRQQPETANGTVFVSLEDETGVVQVFCWESLRDTQRKELLNSRLLAATRRRREEPDRTKA